MNTLRTLLALFLGLALAFAGPPARAQRMSTKPHVHGQAFLMVEFQADVMRLALIVTMADVLGFEHKVRTPQEKADGEALDKLWSDPAKFIRTDAAGGCTPLGSDALFDPTPTSEHADAIALFAFRCKDIDALKSMEVLVMDHHPRIQSIEVEFRDFPDEKKQMLRRGGGKTVTLP